MSRRGGGRATRSRTPPSTQIDALPLEVLENVFDALPPEDRAAVRLVCRAWAGVRLRFGRAGTYPTVMALLGRLVKKPPRTWAGTPRALFRDVRFLEVCSGSSRVPGLLKIALASTVCANLEVLCVGSLYTDQTQRLVDVIAAGAPRLRRLALGSRHFADTSPSTGNDKLWVSGTVRLNHAGAFERLEVLVARHVARGWDVPASPTLGIAMPLPSLRLLHLVNVPRTTIWHPTFLDKRAVIDVGGGGLHLVTCGCTRIERGSEHVSICVRPVHVRFTYADFLRAAERQARHS